MFEDESEELVRAEDITKTLQLVQIKTNYTQTI